MVVYVSEGTVPRPLYLGIEPWSLRGLTDVTVIFGRNGSGKSQLLRRFRSQNPVSRHYVSPERGGDIGFDQERLASQFQGGNRSAITGENAAPNFGEDAIARILAYLTKRGAKRGTDVGTPPEDLEQLLGTVLPEVVVTIRGFDSPYRLQRAEGGIDVTAIQALSSGEAQLFKIAIGLVIICAMWELDSQDERILLIDEPDLHLHPDFQQRLADFIVLLSERFQVQVIIATHSTTMLAALGEHTDTQTSIIYLNNADDVQRAVRFDEELQEMATCLGGHVLMGPLFGAPLLLVEGDDENRIWSQVPRHPGAPKLAVFNCGGRPHMLRYQRRLERLFGAMLDESSGPVGFALVDGDHGLATQPNPDHPQKYVPYLQLACHESENLYLADEVLQCLGTDWERAKDRIKAASSDYGEKQALLANVNSWDRRTHDLKDVINQVAQILDERDLPWSFQIGKCLGASRPSGQLAEFLGDPVIETIWGSESAPPT
jgi:predicted ATPase